jgi:hypothetical protein
MIENILAMFVFTAPLWIFLGILFVSILVVDGWQ